jgi:CheY-like chemotaxis protein
VRNKPRILLVDDDPESAEPLALLLEIEGYRVSKAANGSEALRRLKAEADIALVILDCHMPDMDGGTVLRSIREDTGLCDLPVVIVSAYPERIRNDVQAIFTKPVDVRSLFKVVRKLTNHSPDDRILDFPKLFSGLKAAV